MTWKRVRVTRISQEFEGEGQRLRSRLDHPRVAETLSLMNNVRLPRGAAPICSGQ